MPTSNHQRQQRRATARRAAVATDDVPDAVPRPKGRGPRNHFWDPRPPGVRRHNESNEPNQRRAARLASARGRHADAVRGRRWSRINAARCNEAKSFQAPASSASWRGLHGPSRRPGGRTAGPLARVPGVRDGRVSAPYFEPSWATLASTGRQSTAWATQTARPTSAFDRAQGGTARSALASAHLAFTPATATKEVASAAQMKPVRLVWEPHAVPLSPALLTTPKPTPRNPSRPSLTSWWLASTEPSSFLTPCPRSNSRRPTSDHKKGPRVLRGPASD
ncbi:Hypothetical protein EMIHUDRAFT_253153 [Emiliania huxleyi CCMP1516]|uniref:Uncharacterized protein n=2 Tax=Emiliania huxleyi TaxID=2903 RepID=A0A0D3KC94_EMIH1|nr:Hypothetical protein EMIHUDRAFT_208159 [Emiliania huxleyi CCMP1516]XP_005785808.1 Hypothetical protein EMIHUDRAFT_253153 [Emiliania huxleyi CCMP1516]EOD21041.1 Hypothetical protein EMIHUDRAFT_208159 [Emiliania huxleyi CCMP1516]EOD33379.1 Hypothetical protein EMIHUDRAFT_253153 [Emiliania huxleyi CCMP1516]|eukprot:XP_005773470.1 Hypothetical protein EMIHUDRAFT_208159 [Emiliania huxleyi CCMP1516]